MTTTTPAITFLTEQNAEDEINDHHLPVLVGFHRSDAHAGPQVLEPLAKLAEEFVGKIKVCTVNVDAQPRLALRHHLASYPTFLVFQEGELVQRLVGPVTRPILQVAIGRLVPG